MSLKNSKWSIFWHSILVIVMCIPAFAGEYFYPMVGKWNNTDTSIVLGEYDYQDIQNLRRAGDRLAAVRGHTEINTSVWASTYTYPRAAFHYRKKQPAAESHLFVQAADTNDANPRLYVNTTSPPSQGAFSGSVFYTEDTSAGIGRFSLAPNNFMAYANGEETLIWGGNEIFPSAVYTNSGVPSGVGYSPRNSYDWAEELFNTDTATTAVLVDGGVNADTEAMLHFDGPLNAVFAQDVGPKTVPVTFSGDAVIGTSFPKYGTSSLFLNSGAGYVGLDNSNTIIDTGQDFSIEGWFRFRQNAASVDLIAHYNSAANNNRLIWNQSNTRLEFIVTSGSSITVQVNGASWTPSIGTYYHIAVIRGWGGNNDDYAITINGTQSGSTVTDSDNPVSYTATDWTIGGYSGGSTDFFGEIDDVRIQQGDTYNPGYTANFTAPTAAYSPSTMEVWVGSAVPITSLKFYVDTVNTSTSTMTVSEWQGAANGWSSDLVDTDGTSSGGISLAQTGTVSWTPSGSYDDADRRFYFHGLYLFWYRVTLSAGTATLYGLTAGTDMAPISNIWDGVDYAVSWAAQYDGSTWTDVTDLAQSDDDTPIVMDAFAKEDALYFKTAHPLEGVILTVPTPSTAVASMWVGYWNGTQWKDYEVWESLGVDATVGNVSTRISLSVGGVVAWGRFSDDEPRSDNGSPSLHTYRIWWDADLSADVDIGQIIGIPRHDELTSYTFPAMFQERLWLFGPKFGQGNKIIYSAYNAPWVFNGADSSYLIIGDENPPTAATPLFNTYMSEEVRQLIVTKEASVYRVEGTGPEDWNVDLISNDIGCVAPLSLVTCGVTDTGANVPRQVAVWVGASGVYVCDGATVQLASHDIRSYFDPSHANYISSADRAAAIGWFNPTLETYKLLIGGLELEYSLRYQSWTKLSREDTSGSDPLTYGFQVTDTSGGVYTYGATDDGYVYRLENGSDWKGEADIDQYVHTKDFFLSPEAPFFRDTTIDFARAMFTRRANSTDDVDFYHYCNGTASPSGDPYPATLDDGPVYTTGTNLGPCHYHSFKIQCDTDASGGLDLQGWGMVFEVNDTITTN